MKKSQIEFRLLALLFFIFSHTNSQGQYRMPNLMTNKSLEPRETLYKNLVNAKICRLENKVYIGWSVMNDTIEGMFVVYRTDNSNSVKPIDYVFFPGGLVKNTPLLFSIVDTVPDYGGNTYYVMKIDRRDSFITDTSKVWQYAFATLTSYPQHWDDQMNGNYKQKENLYTQDF